MTREHGTPTDTTKATDAATVDGRGGHAGRPTTRGRRVVRILAAISVVALGSALAGGVAQTIAERRDATTHPAPGDLVDVGDGRKIHLQVSGEQHEDGPTVVLDAGLMGFSPIWAWVQAEVSRQATVVSYDRAGLGWSDPREGDPSAEAFVADLRAALEGRDLEGPYVLVGHSFGGLLVRSFADAHPEEVAGLVLVDPGHEDQHVELGGEYDASVRDGQRLLAVAHAATRLGLTRLYNPLAAGLDDLPGGEIRAASPRLVRTDYLAAVRDEAAAMDLVGDVVRDTDGDLGDTPIRILSAGEAQPGMAFSLQAVQDLHRRLTELSDAATHHVVDGADHLTIITDRRPAEEVSAHILDVVSRTR